MYCPHCGTETSVGLKYCKRCGGNLTAQTQEMGAHQPSPRNIVGAAWAVALATTVICLGGLGIVITQAYELVRPLFPGMERPLSDPAPVAITMIIFGAATVFGVISLLIRLFTRIMGFSQPQAAPAEAKSVFQRNTSPQAQLPAPPSAMPSVTEHTTRTFDPIYRDPGLRD
jgi:Na+-transporting methylmalonyl-CoA/oxaloacetate decarboxylase gamma subunit